MLDFEFGWKLLQGLLGLILEGLDSRVVNWQVQPATPGESTQEFEGRCGIFSSSSSQTPSAELTVNTAFLSACFFCTLSPHAARKVLGDKERFCMPALLWKVKVDSYRKFFGTCREIFDKLSVISAKLSMHVTSVDEAEKDWRLFDIWDRRFDKLPVISAKLSLRVTGADEAEKDWRLFDIWDWRFDKLPVISAKLSLRVTGVNASGKERCFSDF
ncbi:hypothetical protein ACFX1S_013053 [Malus domestica]